MHPTVFSGAILRAGRAIFGTFRSDGAFVALATGAILPVFADDVFTSRGNVTNAMVRKGSALLTGSSVTLTGLPLRERTMYVGPADFIRFATVGDGIAESAKADLIARVFEAYSITEA